MIKIIKERQTIEQKDYKLMFEYSQERDNGFVFPCDSRGEVNLDELCTEAKENYQWCLEHPEKFSKSSPFVIVDKWHYTEPAVGKCACGSEVVLEDQYYGACQCPKCGQWYNIFGQHLRPPEDWIEDIDGDY